MALDLEEVGPYLLERGLLTPRAVVEGQFRVEDVSRLNRVFLVHGPQTLVLKSGPTVEQEAECLRRVWAAAPVLRTLVPPVLALDLEREVLILKGAPDASGFLECQRAGRYSQTLAAQVGTAVGALHALPARTLDGATRSWDLAATVRVHEVDWPTLQTLSEGAVDIVRTVQRMDGLSEELDALVADFGGAEPVPIHGDLRWDNCLGYPARP